ncbi:hypothetical protein PENTCL1PPCAC_11792, partial [Pristionchus entomophagus]
LLLPHQIKSDDGAKVHGINDEDFDKEACPNPEERDCKEGKNGKCTRYCFAVRNCGDENRDITRLLLTKAALLIVNKEGRIEEKYVNRHIAKYSRDYLAKHGKVYNILFRFEFKCGVEEAKKEIEKVTDVILYIGSDYANHYNPPTYGFDPTYLQLKNGGELKNGNRPLELYERSTICFHCIYVQHSTGWEFFYLSPSFREEINPHLYFNSWNLSSEETS